MLSKLRDATNSTETCNSTTFPGGGSFCPLNSVIPGGYTRYPEEYYILHHLPLPCEWFQAETVGSVETVVCVLFASEVSRRDFNKIHFRKYCIFHMQYPPPPLPKVGAVFLTFPMFHALCTDNKADPENRPLRTRQGRWDTRQEKLSQKCWFFAP